MPTSIVLVLAAAPPFTPPDPAAGVAPVNAVLLANSVEPDVLVLVVLLVVDFVVVADVLTAAGATVLIDATAPLVLTVGSVVSMLAILKDLILALLSTVLVMIVWPGSE